VPQGRSEKRCQRLRKGSWSAPGGRPGGGSSPSITIASPSMMVSFCFPGGLLVEKRSKVNLARSHCRTGGSNSKIPMISLRKPGIRKKNPEVTRATALPAAPFCAEEVCTGERRASAMPDPAERMRLMPRTPPAKSRSRVGRTPRRLPATMMEVSSAASPARISKGNKRVMVGKGVLWPWTSRSASIYKSQRPLRQPRMAARPPVWMME